jgi:hypothetical protein
VVIGGVPVVFAMVDVICGGVTEGACAAESVHPAKNTAVMIKKIAKTDRISTHD